MSDHIETSPAAAPLDKPEPSVTHKLRPLAELAAIAEAERSRGGAVALAHGTFDLLHVGHLRYLQEARREGSMLMVTLTADAFVNKGPGRPVFTEAMRAEMLAALDCVDYVGIVRDKMAIPAIEAIQPSVYVKGPDYKDAGADVTGGISLEQDCVERFGGRVVFTDDITFSSSSLINRHFAVFDPELDAFLKEHRTRGSLNRLLDLLNQAQGLRVLIVGDAIIDDYNYVTPMGKTPKEHMIATLFGDREVFAGGVFAAANHAAGLCKEVEIVTVIGDGCEYEHLIRESLQPNVKLTAFRRFYKPTTRKARYIDSSYMRKMFEVYYMDDTPTEGVMEERVAAYVHERASEFDLVIVTDFGHGLITPMLIETLQSSAKFLAVNTQTNSGNFGFNLITRYHRADFICIDAPEARLAVADRYSSVPDIASGVLPSRIDCPRIIVTHGRWGSIGYQAGKGTTKIPPFTKTVVDTVGAGDAYFAVAAPLVALGADIGDAAFVGNAAGAIKVGIVGHRTSVDKPSLVKFLTTLLK